MSYYVFVNNAATGYTVGQAGTPQVADAIPVSRPYATLSLAHDNMLHRQHMPLNERQRAEIEALQARYGMGAARGTERNQAFFDALLKENRWAAGELRPSQACRQAVLAIIAPPKMEPQLLERAVGVGGSAPRLQIGVPPLNERGGRSVRRRTKQHDRT
jgi:hypothetical protein